MRLLDRYLLRELMIPFSYCLSGFFVFWITSDLFNELGELQKRHLTPSEVGEYYLVRTPELLVEVLPIALLLGLLYTLTNLGRHQELTAIRAAGVSLGRLAAPYLGVGLCCSLFLFALNELWVPQSLETAEQIRNQHLVGASDNSGRRWARKVGFSNSRENRQWMIQAYDLFTDRMIQPQVIWTAPDGTRHEISADGGGYQGGHWVFTNALELVFAPVPGALPQRKQSSVLVMEALSETPPQIKGQIKINKITSLRTANRVRLSIREILDYKKWNPERSLQGAMLDTKLHGRFAAPWTCLVVVLIALPFGAAPGRRNAFVGVASSILICFAYFVLQQLGLALGSGGYLPPALAAWAPNLFFTFTGLFLIWRIR